MPKISLEAAKAKDSDILAKLGKVQSTAVSHKQNTKLNQQRHEWIEQHRRFKAEARRLEEELRATALGLPLDREEDDEGPLAQEVDYDQFVEDIWIQVAGVRQLLTQLGRRDMERVRRSPDQVLSLQDVLMGVQNALRAARERLLAQGATLEENCRGPRRQLQRELTSEGVACWGAAAERGSAGEEKADLTDEEEAFLDRLTSVDTNADPATGADVDYEAELRELNSRAVAEFSALSREVSEAAQIRGGSGAGGGGAEWDADAHFRFTCILREFQGKGRDVLYDRLALEFPHLSRAHLQAHEARCDSLKFARQRQTAAFRKWRRERMELFKKAQAAFTERSAREEAQALRRQGAQQQREKQQRLHSQLQDAKSRFSKDQEERQRRKEEARQRQEAEEAEKAALKARHAAATREATEKHKEQRREEKQRSDQEAAERRRLEEQLLAARAEKNRARVEMRDMMDRLKAQEAQRRRDERERERLEQERRLQAAMEKFIVVGERDPSRLLKVPERSQAAKYMDPMQCVTRGVVQNLFDEKKLMSDARYKLSAALQSAGLYSTPAGQEALARVAAPRAAPGGSDSVAGVFAGGYPG